VSDDLGRGEAHLNLRGNSTGASRLLAVILVLLLSIPITAMSTEHIDGSVDKPFVLVIALSGGGFRSAAFSYGVLQELSKLRYCVHKFDTQLMVTKLDYDNGDFKCEQFEDNLTRQGNVLQDVDYISAISGGSFAAAHYSLKGIDGFINTFPDVLKKNIENRLYRNLAWPFDPYFFPVRLVVAALDVPWSLITSPLSLFGVPAPSLTGLLLLNGISGIVSIDDAISIYNRQILGGGVKAVTFGDIKEPMRSKLLIHATDLTREKIFTFDKNTIECLLAQNTDDFDKDKGFSHFKNFPLAAALGASAAEPGMFQPYKFSIRNAPEILPPSCSSVYDNTVRGSVLSLVDGGVYENLGLEGMMPYLFHEKTKSKGSGSEKKKILVLVVNAEVDSNYKGDNGGLINILDQSFDTLMGQRTGLSISLYKELFGLFGIDIIELSFNTLWNSNEVRHLTQKAIDTSMVKLFSEFQLKANDPPTVDFVVPNGRFAKAGLQRGDVFTKYGETRVDTTKQLLVAVDSVIDNNLDWTTNLQITVDRTSDGHTSPHTLFLPSRYDDPLRMPDLSEVVASSKADHDLVKELEELKTTFALTINERDTLIKAGKRLVRDKVGEQGGNELLRVINTMLDREFIQDCRQISKPRQQYCWPAGWNANLFKRPLRPRLEEIWQVVKSAYRVVKTASPSVPAAPVATPSP